MPPIMRAPGCISIAAAALALAFLHSPQARAEQKVALVIGNGAYAAAPLRNPVNDATAMAAKLGALGFDVILRTDVSQREMTRAFSQFGQKLASGAIALFYFSGHGIQVQGRNFLVPVDADIKTEASVRTEGVDVELLLHQLGGARLSIVILDACRNNPFERRFRGSTGGLAQMDAPTGTLIAYATAPGRTADDGPGKNGLYTTELLSALDVPGLAVEDVFKQVRIKVLKASAHQQVPWESSSLTGEFAFRPAPRAVASGEKLLEAERRQAELATSLEEERRKRQEEAASLKREMEKLRSELLDMRQSLPSGRPAPAHEPAAMAAGAAKIPSTGDEKAGRPGSAQAKPRPSQAAVDAKPVAAATPTRPEDGWSRRLAQLQASSGQLSFSKAMAITLEFTDEEELSRLLRFERVIKADRWKSAAALGMRPNGQLAWGRGWGFGVEEFARTRAREECERKVGGTTCRTVVVNGDLEEAEFMAFANQLAASRNNVGAMRRGFLKTLPK